MREIKKEKKTKKKLQGKEGEGGIQRERNETSEPAAQTPAGTNPDTQLLLAFDSTSSRFDQVSSESVGHGISESHHKNASLGLNYYPDSLPTPGAGCLDSCKHSGLVSYYHPSCSTQLGYTPTFEIKTTLDLSSF